MASDCSRPSPDLVTLTIRLIRSFEHRNLKFMVLKNVDLDLKTDDLIAKVLAEIQEPSHNLPRPFKTYQFDTLKVIELSFFFLLIKF